MEIHRWTVDSHHRLVMCSFDDILTIVVFVVFRVALDMLQVIKFMSVKHFNWGTNLPELQFILSGIMS